MLCPAWAKAKCSPWDMEARDKAHLEEKQINDKRRCTLSMSPFFLLYVTSVLGSLPIDISYTVIKNFFILYNPITPLHMGNCRKVIVRKWLQAHIFMNRQYWQPFIL